MRIRNPIKKLSDIVKNPDIRVEFTPDHHQDYLDLQEICMSHKLNMTVFSRHVLLTWKRKFSSVADIEFKNKMLAEIIQSIHGIAQTDIFSKYETWENIKVPNEKETGNAHSKMISIAKKVAIKKLKIKTKPKTARKAVKK